MTIQCQCGSFKAELSHYPKQTPGRLVCYCDDCQCYLHFIKKENLLDAQGGSEIIPIYPSDFKITQGEHLIRGMRLSPKGMYRWYTSCCQTPIANTQANMPWIGMLSVMLPYKGEQDFVQALGQVKSRVMGKFAHGKPPEGTSDRFKPRDFLSVAPFLLKGLILGKSKNHPFFKPVTQEPKVAPYVLTKEERENLLKKVLKTI